jgi:hypothetical protein
MNQNKDIKMDQNKDIKMRKLFLVLIISFVGACTTIGNKFDPQNINLLTPQVSSISDATLLLGPPMAQSAMPDGATLYQWQYAQGTLVGGSGAHLAILFDSEGTMIKVQHMSSTET